MRFYLTTCFVFLFLIENSIANESSLEDLIWNKENSKVIQIIKKNPLLVNEKIRGYSPLHLAAMVGNVELAVFLLNNAADVNAKDAEGYSPLVRAKANQQQEMVNLLISHGGKEIEP